MNVSLSTASEAHEARQAIEHLRSGIPSRVVAARYFTGRDQIVRRVDADLEAIERGAVPDARWRILRAHYGEGKSHSLHALWNLAARRGWAVSWVSLSRETPLDKLGTVYRKLMENTYLPGHAQPGMARLLDELQPNGGQEQELRAFATDNLHGKLSVLVANYMEASGEHLDALRRDLEGDFIKASEVKAIHQLTFRKAVKLEAFHAQKDAIHYFRLADFLIWVGLQRGWLILLDEIELVGKLGKKARGGAYFNLLNLTSGLLPHTYVVSAVADSFYGDVLGKRSEGDELPEWLRARQLEKLAAASEEMVASLERNAVRLEPLSGADLTAVYAQILHDHARGHDWQPPLSPAELEERVRRIAPMADTKLRTRIRAAIAWLDLMMQYGRDPQLRLFSLGEEDVSEDPIDGMTLNEDAGWVTDGDVEAPVERRRIFDL